ncbi:VOC family protein [Mycolicibacterium sp. 050232]|uniref:VOC family protein n=1 Tax=Mycolicibacterium sp. 050232 TaxID=3113982 RepID=UPI002E2AC9C0|nr:VOC family protein [Mycolicibacterium sp. 050232]MED5810851.1 VOC family protein [Mycolicibacterium sp. 050232]
MTPGHRVTHVGLCVRDLARATDFYCTALGFTRVGTMRVDDAATARLLDVPGLILDLVYLELGTFRLELLGYTSPGVTEASSPRPMNAVGFTHLSLRVDDPEALSARVTRHGGQLLAERSVTFDGNRAMMLTDPDGNLLELIERSRPHLE